MANCFRCKNELTRNNSSLEHIIPNALGGRLKSYDLLCEPCNSTFGGDLDSYLTKNIPFPVLLNIERDNDEPYPIKGLDNEGREYKLWYNRETNQLEAERRVVAPVREDLPDGKKRIVFTGEVQGKQIMKDLKKKHPNLNIEKLREDITWSDPVQRIIKYYESQLEGELACRAITKIAVDFYIYSGGDPGSIQQILEFIEGKFQFGEGPGYYYYPEVSNEYVSLEEDEVSHTLYLRGDSDSKLLMCYIDLFSIYKYIIILNDNYLGENSERLYSYELLKKVEITHKKRISIPSPNPWNFVFLEDEMHERFEKDKERVYRIAGLQRQPA